MSTIKTCCALVPAKLIRLAPLAFLSPLFIFAVSVFAQPATPAAQSSAAGLVLEGTVRGSQNQSYVKVPFAVPAGTERVTITFDYTGKEQHTALDLGLLDPAVPALLERRQQIHAHRRTHGRHSLVPARRHSSGHVECLIGVPNIRASVESHYTIHVYLSSHGRGRAAAAPFCASRCARARPGFAAICTCTPRTVTASAPARRARWFPARVFFTVDAAARRGLDFIAITDHNASSQYDAMRELQPYFDKVLLIPGREITTFQGHINFLGSTDFVDFRLDGKTVPDVNTLLRGADSVGAITSINHPDSPTGEICMGCGWTPATPVDMHLLTGVEAVNGGDEQHGISELPFWNKELNRGCRLTGIGGSDNHRPMQPLDQDRLHRQPDHRRLRHGALHARDPRRHSRRPRLH